MKPELVTKLTQGLRAGGVVIFPTDTVWGIGAWIKSEAGIKKLYKVKQRDEHKPTAVLVGSLEQAKEYGDFSREQLGVVQKYWPGALTVIVPAKKDLPTEIVNANGGVGIRWPKWALVEKACLALPGGIVASSANVAGGRPPTTYEQIDDDLKRVADLTVTQAGKLSGSSSTVIDWMGETPKVIRQGEVVLE